jgi:tetratricopeptide (TPR) repeat protein
MPVSNRQFAIWILQRATIGQGCAETGDAVFRGNFQQIQFAKPAREALTTDQAFSEQIRKWRMHLPRGDTFPQALALAHQALVRDGYNDWKAAYVLLQDILPECRVYWAQWRQWFRRHRIRWIDASPTIGGSRRARRTRKKRKGYSRFDRMVERLRTGVARYKQRSQHFDREFEIWYGSFRWQFGRDAAWYAKTEQSYRACLARREATLGPDDYLVAEAAVILGRLYHEQGKFSEGEGLYRRAWSVILIEPTLAPSFRYLMLNQCAIGIGDSASNLPIRATPAYSGPRMVKAFLE